MNVATVRVGVIGTGFGATVMAPAFERLAGYELVNVVNPRDADAIAELCRRSDVDLVSVHSPPFLHRRDVMMALDAGHHVLCDKPLGPTAADSTTMLEHAQAAGVVHATNFEFRHQPWRRALAELVAGGTLGDVRSILWHDLSDVWRTRSSGWQLQRSAGGGWFGAATSHVFDTLRWVCGPVEVRSSTFFVGAADPDRAEDGATIMLTAGDSFVTVVTSAVEAVRLGTRVVVAGSTAVAELTPAGELLLHGAAWPTDVAPPDPTLTMPDFVDRWLLTLHDALAAGTPADVTFADGVEVDCLLDAARAGHRLVRRDDQPEC